MKAKTRLVVAILRDLNPGKSYKTVPYDAYGCDRQIVERSSNGKWLHVAPISNGYADIRLLPDVMDVIDGRTY